MATKGVLVGLRGKSRVYYMLDAQDNPNETGAIVSPDGITTFVNFANLAAFDRLVKPITSSPFQKKLWTKPLPDDFMEWAEIFVQRTKKVPEVLLYGVNIRTDFKTPNAKTKKIENKVAVFISSTSLLNINERGAIAASELNISHKSIGRKITGSRRLAEAFDPRAMDADNDGFVQDGTQWMRPAPPPSPGFRSTTLAERLPDITDELINSVSDENLAPLVKTLRDALNAPTTRQSRNVAIDDYESISAPRIIRVRGVNNKTGDSNDSIELGTASLMEAEGEAHKIGAQIIEIAKKRYERSGRTLKDLRQIATERAVNFEKIHNSYLGGIQQVARQMGVRLVVDPTTGDISPALSFDPWNVPNNPRLADTHARVKKILADIDDATSKLHLLPEDQRPEVAEELLVSSREAQGLYVAALRDEFNIELEKLGKPTIDEHDKAVRDYLEFLSTENTRRSIIAREAWSILRELGIEFGGDLDVTPKRPSSRPTDIPIAERLKATAAEFLPKSLVDQMNQSFKTRRKRGLQAKHDKGNAGSFDHAGSTISTSGEMSTNLHELIHAVAWSNESIQLLQQLVLMARQLGLKDDKSRKKTASARLAQGWENPVPVSLAGMDFNALHDKFPDFYAGRVYEDGTRETLTRAVDYVFDGSFSGHTPDYDLLASLLGSLVIGDWSARNPDAQVA